MQEKAATKTARKRSTAHKLSEDEIHLFKAATDGDEATVRALLAKGVGVDIRDNLNFPLWDQTPLMYAAQKGHLQVVKGLLKAGADVSATDWSFATEDTRANQPLHYAASGGNVAIADELVSAGADINALNSFGEGPLTVAIRNNQVSMVEALVARGPN
jgi:ankyrin repeat protein